MASDSKLVQLQRTGVGGQSESAHHPLFPPSASERWLTCTASPIPISHGYEGSDVNEYSAEGSFAHRIHAQMALLDGDPSPFKLGQTYEQDGYQFTFDREMLGHLQRCIETIDGIGAGMRFVEQRVGFDAGWTDGAPLTRIEGTADVIVQPTAHPSQLHVLDLKYGKGVQVFAEDNSQLMLYALGVLDEFVPMMFDSVQEVYLHVLQPRLDHWDVHRVSISELQKWQATVVEPAVLEVFGYGLGPSFRPSEKACQWCPIGRAGECKAQTEAVLADFDVIEHDDEAKDAPATEVQLMDLETLGRLLRRASWLERCTHAMRMRAERVLLSGEDVPLWKLVRGRSSRRWADENAAGEALEYLVDDIYQERKLLTPPMVEKQLGRKAYDQDVASLVEVVEGRPTLAPENDRREAWVPGNDEDDFDVDLGDLE